MNVWKIRGVVIQIIRGVVIQIITGFINMIILYSDIKRKLGSRAVKGIRFLVSNASSIPETYFRLG